MIINRIDVSVSGRNGPYQRGHVVFEIQDDPEAPLRMLHLHASAKAPEALPLPEMEALLIADALARLRRMPDVRRVTLQFAPDIEDRLRA
ncbi:hypothetical protein [Pseudoruegeria sp. SHC-113]|uniref:hypothetical protein n=1 Tax=Pseudoruegeria sp. SHC-113 TaxID=2855439 RepID=UPI0021BAD9EF|nr:hypothetical protein [Pseudoruegeria sp. SHC-113]MCT8162061.1 hypothetical protein [Pseudoruegeria sp. SHC-113]